MAGFVEWHDFNMFMWTAEVRVQYCPSCHNLPTHQRERDSLNAPSFFTEIQFYCGRRNCTRPHWTEEYPKALLTTKPLKGNES